MIFVTVGSNEHQFDRLIQAVDKLIEKGVIKEKVVSQIGNCRNTPKNIEYFTFGSYEKMEKLTKEASIVITHAGAGSIMLALEHKKPIIAVPRMKSYSEHINDHQIEITKELEKQGRVIGVYKIEDLSKAIERAKKRRIKIQFKSNKIIEILDEYVKNKK